MSWKCIKCGKKVKEIKVVKCPYCGYRIIHKEKPPIVKKMSTQ